MKPQTRKVLIVLGTLWGIPLVAMLVIGLWVKSLGMVSVQVAEHRPGGDNVSVMIPGALASAGLMFLPDVVCAGMAEGIDDRWATVVRAVERELSKCPDAVFVQVESDDENVLIRKEGVHLVIDVDSDDETVHVKVPVKLVAGVLGKIEGFSKVSVDGDCPVTHIRSTKTHLKHENRLRDRRVVKVST